MGSLLSEDDFPLLLMLLLLLLLSVFGPAVQLQLLGWEAPLSRTERTRTLCTMLVHRSSAASMPSPLLPFTPAAGRGIASVRADTTRNTAWRRGVICS